MNDEERPLLEPHISYVEPVAYEESFEPPPLSRLSLIWRLMKSFKSPFSNRLLYPVFWIGLWTRLKFENLQGVCFRSQCRVCRKRSGTMDELTESSDAGCHYCSLFTETLMSMAPQIQPDLGLFTINSESWFGRFPLILSAWNVGGFDTARFRFLAPKVCDEKISCYPGSFHVSSDSTSNESMVFAIKSIENCVNNHKTCRKPRKSRLPRRVIDVGNFDLTNDVKLYESRGERAKYIALSHTWGQKHTFMTKTSNLSDHKNWIPLHALPRTFQDAVFMARKLRIRYIWIDSLCIIQDDLGDWEQESPKMGAIYGEAYLTVAAGSALNDESGFLGLRTDPMYRDIHLKNTIQQCVSITRVQDLTAPERRDPLSFRAWAFQERLLSKRTLYYHQQELVFECKEGLQCECMSCSRVLMRFRQDEKTHMKRLGVTSVSTSFPRIEMPVIANQEDLQHFWRTFIVPEYSSRSITRDSDRLPALSSVAAAVHRLSNDSYLAGMWRLSLPADLAWSTVHNARSREGNRMLASLPSSYVAPSWSWASISGPVEYKEPIACANITYIVSVAHAECTRLGANPFGNVTGGCLILSGPILYGTCELQVEPHRLWPCRVKLMFQCPKQMTLGFESDVPYLVECDISNTNDASHELQPEEWSDISKTLRRHSTTTEGEPEVDFTWSPQGDGLTKSLSFGRVICLLLYKNLQLSRCEWVFLVLGDSTNNPGGYERLEMLTCWINDWAKWEELDALAPQLVTIW